MSGLHKLIQRCESRAQQARQEARIRQEAEARARAEATRSQEEQRRRDKEKLTPTTAEGETTSHTATTQVHRFYIVGLYHRLNNNKSMGCTQICFVVSLNICICVVTYTDVYELIRYT